MTGEFPTTRAASSGLSTVGLLRSEWIKMRTLRSTVWAFLITLLLGVGFSALLGATFSAFSTEPLPAEQQIEFGVQAATAGLQIAQLSVAVLGVLLISGEYSTGMIRSTLTAVPRRLPALWAKAAVLAFVTFIIGSVLTFASYFVSAPLLASTGIETSITDSGVIPALFGGALYLTFAAIISLGLGTMLRSSAGGIAAAIGVLLLLPILFALIPGEIAMELSNYLPGTAGQSLFMTDDGVGFEVWQAALVMLGWSAVTLGGGALLLTRRDA